MRSSVVLPAPFGPSRATNSPGEILSDTSRKACSGPNRFSIFSKETPRLGAVRVAEAGVALVVDKGSRSASHEVAQRFLHALAVAGVILLGDCTGFAAQFEAEERVLEFVEAASHFAV